MVIKKIALILFTFLFVACSSTNIQENSISHIESQYLNKYKNNKNSSANNIKSKWIQAYNKEEACKVFVEYDKNNDRTKKSDYKIFWDGECENGYAKGLGKEFEKALLIDNTAIAVYENAPLKKPKYFSQNFMLKDIETIGDLNNGYKVFEINKYNSLKYRYGYFPKNNEASLITYSSNDEKSIIYKKIYPNFNYEIIYNKENKKYQYFFNSSDKKYKLTNIKQRNHIIREVLEAKEIALKKYKEAKLVKEQYKRKICKNYISVNFLDYDEYKSICFNDKRYTQVNSNKKFTKQFEDELEYLLKSSKISKKNNNSYAIILGIEDYLLESNVNFSHNSANMFAKYAKRILGVPDDNIWTFTDNRETSAGFIKSQWSQFLSTIPKDSTVYFYYSGHGVPGLDGNPYILPSDTNAQTVIQDKQFMLNNIYKNLTDTKANKIIAFVDSCFSGKDDNGNLLFGGVAPVLRTNPIEFDKNKMVIFTAGGENEFSNQYKKKHHRLFSYYLMKGLAKGYEDSKELYKYLKKNVANKSRKMGFVYKQTPQLLGLINSKIK